MKREEITKLWEKISKEELFLSPMREDEMSGTCSAYSKILCV
jgi:hypothetical protein